MGTRLTFTLGMDRISRYWPSPDARVLSAAKAREVFPPTETLTESRSVWSLILVLLEHTELQAMRYLICAANLGSISRSSHRSRQFPTANPPTQPSTAAIVGSSRARQITSWQRGRPAGPTVVAASPTKVCGHRLSARRVTRNGLGFIGPYSDCYLYS